MTATNIEVISALERRVLLTVSTDEVTKEVGQRLKRIARNAKMPGFRPGKVPMKMIEQSYGYQVQSEVLGDVLGKVWGKTVEEQQLRVAGQPTIEPQDNASEGELKFSATFEVFPEVTFGDFAAETVEKLTCDITEADIAKTIDVLRRQRATFKAVERAAQNEDRVTVDFVGTLDGVEFAGGKADDYVFVLGQQQMLPEFETAILGLNVGEKKVFPLAFPEDYHGKDVAGKTAEFTVTVKKVEEIELPELTPQFIKTLGIEGDASALENEVRSNLSREIKHRLLAKNKQTAFDVLRRLATLEVPKALLSQDKDKLRAEFMENLKQRGIKEGAPIPDEFIAEQSERRVRLGLALGDLVRQQKLEVQAEQIRHHVEDVAANYEQPQEIINWYYADITRLDDIQGIVLENNVVNWIHGVAKTVEKPISFDELMGNQV